MIATHQPDRVAAGANAYRTLARRCLSQARVDKAAGRPVAAAYQVESALIFRAGANALIRPIDLRPKR